MTNDIEVFDGDRYEIVAWARNQEVLYYHEFGSYQGEWILLARDKARTYYIYTGYYGSCSGCDSFEAEFGYGENKPTRDNALKFVEDTEYKPFIEIPQELVHTLVKDRELIEVLPRNINDNYSDMSLVEVGNDFIILISIEEGLPLSVDDVFRASNIELRRKVTDIVGADSVLSQSEILDIDEQGDKLIKLVYEEDEWRMLYLQDSSTPRKYLLRVPNSTNTVLDGKAWSFSVDPSQYNPIIET